MINIAKLLKDAPKGMKLYSPLLGEVEFAEVMDTGYMPIRVMKRGYGLRFDKYGRYMGNEYPDAECVLFPSKEVRTWEGWKPPVEPKFKVVDWIVRGKGFVYEPSLITEIRDYYICELLNGERVTYTLNDVHKNFHLWTIADTKDGDVLCTYECGEPKIVFIHKLIRKNGSNIFMYYCFYNIMYQMFDANNEPGCLAPKREDVKPATKEQRDLLFTKMREAGYEWDAGKKELRKIIEAKFKVGDKIEATIYGINRRVTIRGVDKTNRCYLGTHAECIGFSEQDQWHLTPKPHYDIKNFYAGMPVLQRSGNDEHWDYNIFSRYLNNNCSHPFILVGCHSRQCIPLEGNEHLLGTTDMCDEQYINW